jgi:hypothetical protein
MLRISSSIKMVDPENCIGGRKYRLPRSHGGRQIILRKYGNNFSVLLPGSEWYYFIMPGLHLP